MTRYLITPLALLLLSACSSYSPRDMALACDQQMDWSERQACRAKSETYTRDWEKAAQRERSAAP